MSKFKKNQHSESPKLGGFNLALKGWLKALALYSKAAQGDYSWNYRERTCVGFLAAGIWRSGGVALEEWSASKHREFDKHQGRCDLWAFHAGQYDFHIEAKHMWSRATGIREKDRASIERHLASAASEAHRLDCGRNPKLGILFIAPLYPVGRQENVDAQITEWLEDISTIRHDAIAWQFRDRKALRSGHQQLGPGMVLMARRAHPKKSDTKQSTLNSMDDQPSALTEYENQQIIEIKDWKLQEPSTVSKAIGYLFTPVTWLLNKIIPAAAMRGALDFSNAVGKWTSDLGSLKSDAGVKEFAELLEADLEKCDRLANGVHDWAIGLATTEGGVAGFFGLPGMVADVPVIISFALRTIHAVGLAYGFSLETEEDRQFALAVLATSGANTIQEKVAALAALRSIQVMIAKQTWKKMAEQAARSTLGKEAGIIASRNLAKQLGINLTKRKAAQAIPVIGAGVGASVNGWWIKDVGWAARRAFQERWLIHNRKVTKI